MYQSSQKHAAGDLLVIFRWLRGPGRADPELQYQIVQAGAMKAMPPHVPGLHCTCDEVFVRLGSLACMQLQGTRSDAELLQSN